MKQPFHFADELILRVRKLGHPLCVGLDPHLAAVPPLFRDGAMKPGDPRTVAAVREFLLAFIDRLEGRTSIVKPQSAFYEQLGAGGVALLADVMDRARQRGLLVLLDAKRGDIGSTADAYARAYLEPDSPMAAEALTVNPYLGLDSLDPFAQRSRDHGRGMFVLVRTSNPGARDLQDLEVQQGLDAPPGLGGPPGAHGKNGPLFHSLARLLAPLEEELRGPQTGWSSLGVVVGATWPEDHQAVRDALPRAVFLVPGYGAQGAAAVEAVRRFAEGPAGGREGGIVSSSRGVMFPTGADTDDASVWEQAIDAALDQATSELGEAVSR